MIVFCLLGTCALCLIAYKSTPPSNSSVFIEVTKTLFLCLGGQGVIIPIYINATNAIEARINTKIDNTFHLLEKWDNPNLFSARKFTRDIKEARDTLSDVDLVGKIKSDDELKQSVILVSNYLEHVRVSIIYNRIELKMFKNSLGPVMKDIIKRFEPYYKEMGKEHLDDLKQLDKLLS